MKNFLKKTPAFVVVSLIIIATIALTIFAASVVYDANNDGALDDKDVSSLMDNIVGKDELPSGTDFDLVDDDVINVLDVIALKNFITTLQTVADGYTVGIY